MRSGSILFPGVGKMVELPEKSCYTVVREYSGSGSTSSQKSLENGVTVNGIWSSQVSEQSFHDWLW